MPSRKLAYPSSLKQDRKPQLGSQTVFTDVFQDPPSTDLPEGAVAKAYNGICRGNDFEPRFGSILWGNTFPAISGRTGYDLEKDGYYVNARSGEPFQSGDVSNLIGWGNDLYDEIVEYISATRVRVRDDDPNQGTDCWIQGKLNLWKWHPTKERWVIQLGQDFYISTLEMTTYTRVYLNSRIIPNNQHSDMIVDDRYATINNSAGLFRINFETDPPSAYMLNTRIPQQQATSNDDDGEKNHRYHYIFALAYFDCDDNFSHRETTPVPPLINTESGTNMWDEDRRDWAINYADDPIGDGVGTYQVLEGAALGGRTNPVNWVESDGTFWVNINGLGTQQILCDFSAVVTMYNVASVIQAQLRKFFPSATCEYIAGEGNARLRITSGRILGGTVSAITVGTTGTDIATNAGLTAAAGATIVTENVGVPHVLRDLRNPSVPGRTPTEYESFWNRYVVYRCGDLGRKGFHLDTKGRRIVNSQDELIWVKDLRVAGAFLARACKGIIHAREGEFEEADVGSVIEFENGDRYEITEYIDSTHVRYARDYYYDECTGYMAAAIGNGRVFRASQSGDIVTRHGGASFSSTDERKMLWWPTGARSMVIEYLDANRVRVADTASRSSTGMTTDPRYRNFNDNISDEKLFSRASAWNCKNRFMQEFELGNVVSIQPGFIITCIREENTYYYCQLESGYRQFVGYHNKTFQKVKLEDEILEIWDFPDRYAVLCKGSIHYGVTNNATIVTVPATQQIISVVSQPDQVANFGISNNGAIIPISDDYVRVITSTGEVRDFNGVDFGPDLAKDESLGLDKFVRAIRAAHPQFAGIFAREIGWVCWWRTNSGS